MAIRSTALAALCCLILSAGCDDSYTPPPGSSGSTTAATEPAATVTTAAADSGPRERIALGKIPFTIEAPKGWRVQPGVTQEIVLHGRAPSGEVDVLLGAGTNVKADALPMLVKQSARGSNDRHIKNEVVQRANLTIVKSIAPQLAPGSTASPDPELVPMGWTVQVIVSGTGTDLPSYQLTFLGLSQAMFDKDEAFLQQVMDSLRYDPAATVPAAP